MPYWGEERAEEYSKSRKKSIVAEVQEAGGR